ncbi:DMT family transporter [Zavarzinia compransoris]|nr:DMT family transporter [Zavarzinia marina]
MTSADWGLLGLLSVLWGGSFFFTGIAVRELPPFTIVTLRVGIAALALLGFLALQGRRLPRGRDFVLACIGMGFLNNMVPFSLIVTGQGWIASGLAAILNATTPLFAVVVGHVLTDDEKMTPARLGGVVTGFLGVALMLGPALGGAGQHLAGMIAVLGAAFSYACAGVFGRRFRRLGIAPIEAATGQVTAATLMMLPLALAVDQPWTLAMPAVPTVAAVVGAGVLSTALAYGIYFRILQSSGATNAALVTFLIPVSAVFLGAVFLGEALDARHFGGMALIAAGLAAIDGRLLSRSLSKY